MRLEVLEKRGFMACVESSYSSLGKIKGKRYVDEKLSQIRDIILQGQAKEAVIIFEGILTIKG